jgi:hypothetical protein
MLPRLRRTLVPFLVCFLGLVVWSTSAIADPGSPTTDPLEPDDIATPIGVTEPTGGTVPTGNLTDVVVDVVQYGWSMIWLVIL